MRTITVATPRLAEEGAPPAQETFAIALYDSMVRYVDTVVGLPTWRDVPQTAESADLDAIQKATFHIAFTDDGEPPCGSVMSIKRSKWLRMSQSERRALFRRYSIHVVSEETCGVLEGHSACHPARDCTIASHEQSGHACDPQADSVMGKVRSWDCLAEVVDINAPRQCHCK